jgi:hypothetical protein
MGTHQKKKKKKKKQWKVKICNLFPSSLKESFSKPLCGNLKDDSCELLVT